MYDIRYAYLLKSLLSYLFLSVIVDSTVSETQFTCTLENNTEHSPSNKLPNSKQEDYTT